MRNYVQRGWTLTLPAPYAVASGDGFKVDRVFAVANTDAEAGAEVEGDVEGVFDLAKTSAEAWTVGARLYWNDAAREVTTTATGNTLIGVAVAAAPNPSAVGRVRLNGSF